MLDEAAFPFPPSLQPVLLLGSRSSTMFAAGQRIVSPCSTSGRAWPRPGAPRPASSHARRWRLGVAQIPQIDSLPVPDIDHDEESAFCGTQGMS